MPIQSQDKVVLAIGKGSGSIEAWICHIFSNKFQSAGIYDAHDQVVCLHFHGIICHYTYYDT